MRGAAKNRLDLDFHRPRGQGGVQLNEDSDATRQTFARKRNSRLLALFVLLFAGLFWVGPRSTAAQNITGTVTAESDKGVGPAQDVQVKVFDSANAEILAQTTTDLNGQYDTGSLPIGTYRVRFSDTYGNELPTVYYPDFFGTTADVFCSGTIVDVQGGTTATADGQVEVVPIAKVVPPDFYNYSISGTVMDADTLAALVGIQVTIFGYDNALPLATAITDSVGHWDVAFGTYERAIRVRFSDPSNAFFPSFFGAGNSDDYCKGTFISDTPDELAQLDQEYLVPIPPDQLTQNLVDQIQNLTVPSSVSTVLGAPLTRAVSLIEDGNVSNDSGACGQLTSFISRVDAEEKNGQLTSADADSLRQSTEAVLTQLGCQ